MKANDAASVVPSKSWIPQMDILLQGQHPFLQLFAWIFPLSADKVLQDASQHLVPRWSLS